MGYELRREIREALGPNVTGLQRAVALEIADDARHDADGRRSRAALKDLARWTGAKDTAVVRNALKRLAEAGWEFRIPIGKGKDGRVLYATPGHAMQFRVPYPPEGATAHSEGAGAHSEGAGAHSDVDFEEGATAHSEGAGAHSEGAPAPSEGAGAPPPPQPTTHTTTTAADSTADEPADKTRQQGDSEPPTAAKKPAKKAARKPKGQKAAAHPVADELAAAFWDRHGKGRAQNFLAIRGVIRTAIGNGVERNELAHALERLVNDGMSVSGSTIDIALNKIRRNGRTGSGPKPAPRDMTEEEKQDALRIG